MYSQKDWFTYHQSVRFNNARLPPQSPHIYILNLSSKSLTMDDWTKEQIEVRGIVIIVLLIPNESL